MRTTSRRLGVGISAGCDWLDLIAKGGTNGFSRHSRGWTSRNNIATKRFPSNIFPPPAFICRRENFSVAESGRPPPAGAIARFKTSERLEFPRLIELDEPRKMAAAPPREAAVAKRRVTKPRPLLQTGSPVLIRLKVRLHLSPDYCSSPGHTRASQSMHTFTLTFIKTTCVFKSDVYTECYGN